MRIKPLPFKVFSLIVVNAAIYAASALYYCFIQIYLSAANDAVTVGSLLSVGQVVAVFAPVLWGVWADKAKYKNTVLFIASLASGICYFGVMLSNNFLWLAFALSITVFSLSAFGGLIDTITIEYSAESGYRYGSIRVMGTIAYGVVACGLSLFLDKNIYLIFILYGVLCGMACLFLCFSPKVEGHSHADGGAKRPKMDFKSIFADRNLMWMFIMAAVGQMAWAYYQNFFPTYLKKDLLLPDWVWGVNVLLTVLGEIPFFLCFNRLFDKFGIKKILLSAIALTVVRYALLALLAGAAEILAVGMVTGISITVYTYCCAIYIKENLAPGVQATAQTVMYAFCFGTARIAAGVGGGLLTDAFGTPVCLGICAALALVTLIIFPFVFRKREISRA